MTFQICAPHFTAGFTVNSMHIVTTTAPIIKFFRGKSLVSVAAYCRSADWHLKMVSDGASGSTEKADTKVPKPKKATPRSR